VTTLAWILLAALIAAVLLCAVLFLGLRRSRARAARTEQLVTEARRAVRAAAEEESSGQAEQLRVSIARAQADSLSAYVSEERRLLEPVKRLADRVLDTTALTVHELRRRVRETVGGAEALAPLSVTVPEVFFVMGTLPAIGAPIEPLSTV